MYCPETSVRNYHYSLGRNFWTLRMEPISFFRNVCKKLPLFTAKWFLILSTYGIILFIFGATRTPPPQWAMASRLSIVSDHTQTHHTRYDSFGRVISPMNRPLPDNTQHSQRTDIHDTDGIRTSNPRNRAGVDPRLRTRGHWKRHISML
jgi:hypothetical protein